MLISLTILSLCAVLGAAAISAFTKTIDLLGRIQIKKECARKPYFYLFLSFVQRLFPEDSWECLLHLLSTTKHLLRLIYSSLFFYALHSEWSLSVLADVATVVGIGVLIDFLFKSLASISPQLTLRITSPFVTLFLLLFSSITLVLLKAFHLFLAPKQSRKSAEVRRHVKEKILELVHESELSSLLEPLDQRLISAIASFRDRIAREIMVPRVDIFSLSINQTVHEAAQKFISEGYSRIPVYKESVDNIVGVLLYKDVMEYYFHSIENKEQSPLSTPLEELIKPILYSPETKKISHLLQEFRQKQIHIAIVVDEYGGTEGIVTFEDILEELVGEIADEYDIIEEEKLYESYPGGGWLVDAKMNVLDVEKEMGIQIPHSSEYDTIGGFVFHRAGTIPSKGWKIHHDHFDLEVHSTSDRTIEKLIICPSSNQD